MDYSKLADKAVVEKTSQALADRGVKAIYVATKEEALAKVKELIPKGASVNNGSSTTLQEIGLIDYLKGNDHGWNNLHSKVLEEKDSVKQAELRKSAFFSDYYMGSVHALTEGGEMVIASASGSQLPHLITTSPNLVLVVSTMKIMPTLEKALERLRAYVVPLENDRMQKTGAPGTTLAKIVILEREPAWTGRTINVILVNEKLGF